MSWDVVLLKTKINLVDKNANPDNLGKKDEIIERLTTLLPTLDYSDTSWGIFTDKNFSIEFNTGTDDIVETIMLHIRGGGDPLVIIKIICDSENWFALDCSTTEYIDTDNLSKESWENFQKFRDKIIDGN
jgi:hypothetical protein